MSQRKPSEILSSLAEALPPDTFLKIISQNLYPILDCLPESQQFNIASILEPIEKTNLEVARKIASVDYDGFHARLQRQLKDLEKDVRRNWKDGYEEQGEMMGEICGEIAERLSALWTLGVEEGLEIPLVHKTLRLCLHIINKTSGCGSRAELFDIPVELSIRDQTGKTVYELQCGGCFHAIAWTWRELLLSALVNYPNENQTLKFINDIEQEGFLADVEQFLRDEDETETVDGESFFDEHWDQNYQTAATQLKTLLRARRIAEFKTDPSYAVYRSIAKANPELKDLMLETARSHFFDEHQGTVSWTSAVNIFKDAGSTDDILKVVDIIGGGMCTPDSTKAKKEAILYLMDQEKYRLNALEVLKASILASEEEILDSMHDAFPGLDEAYEYLEEKIEDGKFSEKEQPSSKSSVRREKILEKFISIARNGAEEDHVEDYRWEQQYNGLNEGDSDYEEMRDAICPDLGGVFDSWMDVLHRWSDKEEANTLRKTLKGADLFYTVDGLADALADRCDYSGSKAHIAEGIRSIYKAFGPHS